MRGSCLLRRLYRQRMDESTLTKQTTVTHDIQHYWMSKRRKGGEKPYITKSIPPNSSTHFSTAPCKLRTLLTSTSPNPSTLAPCLAVAISLAILSVFSTFRPTMHASAPKWTRARTWALQMVPAPPVQKTTLFAECFVVCIS